MDSDGQLWTVVDLSSGLEFSRPLDKYPGSEFDLSGGLGCSRPPDKHPESELDLSSGLEFSRSLDKYTENEFVCAKWTVWPPAVHVLDAILESGRRRKYKAHSCRR